MWNAWNAFGSTGLHHELRRERVFVSEPLEIKWLFLFKGGRPPKSTEPEYSLKKHHCQIPLLPNRSTVNREPYSKATLLLRDMAYPRLVYASHLALGYRYSLEVQPHIESYEDASKIASRTSRTDLIGLLFVPEPQAGHCYLKRPKTSLESSFPALA